MVAALRFRPLQGLARVIPPLQIRVPIITDGVIGIVLFLGVDPIAGHAIDRDDDTPGDLTPSDAGLFRGIPEIEGCHLSPRSPRRLRSPRKSPLIHHEEKAGLA